ncbi:hypothetical protein CJ030_MR8G019280 [Morella rubra]|uniref:Uncharacterized protein n=1 Tax=Morella rubra TaxID=262757 RepID=A0A6A1UP86_9ROSI|nr:hypothetical protein CJ030_MR8G019280 [Morella rubra]
MERDLTRRRSLCVSECVISPASCFPMPKEMEYSRINCCSHSRRSWRLRNLLRRLVRDSKNFYGSKPLSFHYDAVSYSQNFDEGSHVEVPGRHYKVFEDVRWDLIKE